MIDFNKFELDNQLKVIVHEDRFTPFAVVNILYDVGARDEDPERTGFAHLFEHLMFEGTVNIPVFDKHIERAGGKNNAFTNNDFTNYYDVAPAANIETLFWLESDRMSGLDFAQKGLDLQKKVVSEEFKEHYLNQPYGDVWHKMRAMAYKDHPYQWPTIGRDLAHIENASIEDVSAFFYKHYRPGNAILVVAGNVSTADIQQLAEKYFAKIETAVRPPRNYSKELKQEEPRSLTVEADVPLNAIYKAYHMCSRTDSRFHASDIITDLLAKGASSRLLQSLVKEKNLFSSVDAYITGNIDEGLIVVEGMLLAGVTMEDAEQAIIHELEEIKLLHDEDELQKVKNKIEAQNSFERVRTLNKAMELAYFELLGDASLVNSEMERYHKVTVEDIKKMATDLFIPSNCSTIYYYAK